MAVSRRELEFLVSRALADIDNATLVNVAKTVLGKDVVVRAGRFSLKAKSPSASASEATSLSTTP